MTDTPSSPDSFNPIFLRMPPENIVLIMFLIESYEGIGIVRTLDRERGEIVILALDDTVGAVRELLASLEGEFEFRIVPPPESLANDWLLKEWAEGANPTAKLAPSE